MRWSFPLAAVVVLVLTASGLAGCVSSGCGADPGERCDSRLVKVVAVTAMTGAFDLHTARTALMDMGFEITSVNGTDKPPQYDADGNRTGVQVWANHTEDPFRLGLLVSGGHLENPEAHDWGVILEFPDLNPRALSEADAMERAQRLQVDSKFFFDRTLQELQAETGWQQTGEVHFRPVMEPVE